MWWNAEVVDVNPNTWETNESHFFVIYDERKEAEGTTKGSSNTT